MLPTSLAFTWVAWRQHRWGMLLVLSGLLLAATLAVLMPAYWPKTVAALTFGLVVLPLVSLTVYPLVIFTYGFDAGDVLARESCFPTGLLRLPLRTRTLVLWPLVFGAAVAFLLWLAVSFLIFRPWLGLWDVAMPLWWPSMMAVALLAWFQALFWMPFGLPWLRAILVVLMVQAMIAAPIYGAHADVSEASLVALFTGVAAAGWTASCLGVRLARRGDVPNWEWILSTGEQLPLGSPGDAEPFASASHAQGWFEWRTMGKTLPVMTGFLLPIAFLPLIFSTVEINFNANLQSLLCALAVPVFFASVAGWIGSRRSQWARGRTGTMPFIATLPMTTADMLGSRLKAAARSTLATFAAIALAWPVAVLLTGNFQYLGRWFEGELSAPILLQIAARIVAIAVVLHVWTWKRQFDSLYVGLIGSKWIEAAVACGSIPVTYCMCLFVASIYESPHYHYATTVAAWPWFLGVLIVLRLLTAVWSLREVMRQSLLQPRTVASWVAAWLLLASVLFILLAWALPPGPVPVSHLAFGVVFTLPMVRLAAAPLVVAWNRHR